MHTFHTVLFVNPLRVRHHRAVIDRCAATLREGSLAGIHTRIVDIRETRAGDAAAEQARAAVAEGVDTIFACGGDGTVFHLLQGIAGSDTTLGIIPLGTGNILAHNLGLPRDPVAALRAQLKAPVLSVPLGEVAWGERRWLFTFAAGIGMHAALMGLDPNGPLKRRLGRAAYFADGAKLLLTRPVRPFDAEITSVEGVTERVRASELICARVEWINRWHAGADIHSRRLKTAFVPETNRLGLAYAFAHDLIRRSSGDSSGRRTMLPLPQYRDAALVVCQPIEGVAAPLPVEADGEFLGEVAEAKQVRFGVAQERILLPVPDTRRR